MNFVSENLFDFGDNNELFFRLLCEEDFDFKNKNILIEIDLIDKGVFVKVSGSGVLDFKIANSSLVKSLEVVEKTIK